MKFEDIYPLALTLPEGWYSEYDMEAIAPALEAIPENGVYLEVGVHKGTSLAFARTLVKPSVNVYGIDIVDNLDPDWFVNHEEETGRSVHHIVAPSNEAFKNWDQPIDVLFIDGDHSYQGCLDDWNNFSSFVRSDGYVFFHDCDETSPGVVQVFNEIGKGWKDKTLYKKPGKNTSMASVRKV